MLGDVGACVGRQYELAAEDLEPIAVSAEELLQEVQVARRLEGCGSREYSEFLRLIVQAEPVAQVTQEESDLRACGAPVHVELVDDQGEVGVRDFFEPSARLVENARLTRSHQHDVEHAVVRDHDVWRSLDHVPAGAHLRAVEPRDEEPAVSGSLLCLPRALLRRGELLAERLQTGARTEVAGDRRCSGVPAEVEAVAGS